MNNTTMPAPHRIILDRPYRHAFVGLASLLLTFWAIYVDPVINVDGIDYVRSAQYFLQGEWGSGFAAGGNIYSAVIALLSLVTGLSVPHAAYGLNAGFHVLLVYGFIAAAGALGGGRNAQILAAMIILLYPTLNGVRSHITSDAIYWACFVWALAWFMHYVGQPDRRGLVACMAWTVAALLFGLEALVFLVIVSVWWWMRGADNSGSGKIRLLRILIIIAGAGLIGCYSLWQEAWQSGVPVVQFLREPLGLLANGWGEAREVLGFKLQALRTDFLDEHSQKYDDAALLITIVWLAIAALFKALGLLYFCAVAYFLVTQANELSRHVCYWWSVTAIVGLSILLAKVVAGLEERSWDVMTPAFVLLAIAPPALERLWQSRFDARGAMRWVPLSFLVLVLANGVHGMDLSSGRYHLREAGLWLNANAGPGDSVYSDNAIVPYYAGLEGPSKDYSWRKVMNMVQREEWRMYDYLAVEIPRSKPYREAILTSYLDIKPVLVFSADGGRVLIFSAK